MVFHQNRVELVHQASGTTISFNALDALLGWKREDLPPLQVRVAEEWRKAREAEIQQQKAVQLTYDWTYTTPYTCTVDLPAATPEGLTDGSGAQQRPIGGSGLRHVPDFVCSNSTAAVATTAAATGALAASDAAPSATAAGAVAGSAAASAASPAEQLSSSSDSPWQPTADQIDRGLLMERDPILFYDEVPLYESDLDDNGVSAVTVKLRVMPRCWLVLLRFWLRVDGCCVRLRETRLFCRHDRPDKRLEVLQEVKHCEGSFADLRARGAPDEGPAYADGDAASQVFQAVAPVGLRLLETRRMTLPGPQPAARA
ncbi:hypothetical protein GPECTOR_88g452 [Gonium pectorale]|uniref:TIP41-like protein n=1 Tax=Gonium pectorale TaxID=33097 RepID=A0A150G0X9_GONPE|nr:hypothetical protein GPECTOR_88g452 [Gonium pectorale]|eukprot:KXZ43509.1 hypothetical protein GPECTOR_88g452 [Gonium pectorale]